MPGDLMGHQLLEQVQVHRVAGLGAAGCRSSLQRGRRGREERTLSLGAACPTRTGHWKTPFSRPRTYPLVNELELEVALAAVRVGLGAGLQRVPVVLSAAEVLAGQRGRSGPGPCLVWVQSPSPKTLFPDPTHL